MDPPKQGVLAECSAFPPEEEMQIDRNEHTTPRSGCVCGVSTAELEIKKWEFLPIFLIYIQVLPMSGYIFCDQILLTRTSYSSFMQHCSPLGELHYRPLLKNTDILEAPPRKLPPLVTRRKMAFGTIGYGMDLVRQLWPQEHQVFSLQDLDMTAQLPKRPTRIEGRPFQSQPKSFLHRNPVDVLLIEGLEPTRSSKKLSDMLTYRPDTRKPLAIVVAGGTEGFLMGRRVDQRKQFRKHLESLGYTALEWLLQSHEHGGALDQEVLMDIYVLSTSDQRLPINPISKELPARPMRNLLLPCGIPKRDWAPHKEIELFASPEQNNSCQISGYLRGRPIYHPDGVLPDSTDSWIDTEKGVRRIQISELAKAKGLPSEWTTKATRLPPKMVGASVSVHSWAPVCDSIYTWLTAEEEESMTTPRQAPSSLPSDPDEHDVPPPPWEYEMEDLSPNGEWYQDRIRSLKQAIQGRPDAPQLLAEGMEALDIHRGNYTEEGPKYLQILWWEFPEAQREEARLGSSMRFLIDPGTSLVANPLMTAEQTQVVETFVNELMELGVLRKSERELRRVCPLFVVPKLGQPGQWRCIADMRRGGQNDCCSLDPIYLPSVHDILPHLYSNGWSAIADASKYFHNYQTLPSERDLIGIIHPVTGEHLWYVGLPMGSVNSPSIACRFGEGILNMLRTESPVFRGVTRKENTWRTALQNGSYDPNIGHGYVYYQRSGSPVALIFGFVDDFKIHASTRRDCVRALVAFMKVMVRLGLICQPVKTSAPAQVQKYCGFIYDTRKSPVLRIPANKVSRCLSSAQFLLKRPRNHQLSRLSLAVVTGVLQSIVEATPQHAGQSHLRSLYDDLHRIEEVGHLEGREKYYTTVSLSMSSTAGLNWWVLYST